MTHIHVCVSKLTIIGSDNGLSPDRCQAIIWTNAGLLLIGPLGTNFSEILIEILTFSFKKMRLKVSSGKRRPFCLGLNVLNSALQSRLSYLQRSGDGRHLFGISPRRMFRGRGNRPHPPYWRVHPGVFWFVQTSKSDDYLNLLCLGYVTAR